MKVSDLRAIKIKIEFIRMFLLFNLHQKSLKFQILCISSHTKFRMIQNAKRFRNINIRDININIREFKTNLSIVLVFIPNFIIYFKLLIRISCNLIKYLLAIK